MFVQKTRVGRTLLLCMSNGPVNVLSIANGFVAKLLEEMLAGDADSEVDAIVLHGAGRVFCGGADISDFDRDPVLVEQLRDLVAIIEDLPTPVVMALHGVVLGGGLELAMAGDLRIAQADTRLGLPEVELGLLPGAGGTQRLPRLAGATAALEMMLSGEMITAEAALSMGLIDHRVEGDVVAAALEVIDRGLPPSRRTGSLPVPADLVSSIEMARENTAAARGPAAKAAIIECVAHMASGLEVGLAVEAASFSSLLQSESSRALRHAFFGERQVSRIPGLPTETIARNVSRVGIVGGGLMGTGIAISFLNAGFRVTLVEQRAEALAAAAARVERTIRADIAKGRIDEAVAVARINSFESTSTLHSLTSCDLIVEAVFEEMDAKKQVFAALDTVVGPNAILASNTSTLDIDAIAATTRDPRRVVGLHFFSPANIMRLLEIVRGRETAPDVLGTAIEVGKRLGKVGVVSGVCDGFIGNRIFEEYLRQVWFMLEEGALPHQIDAALEAWGMAMGPCRTMDLVGQDIGWAIRKRRAIEQPDRPYSQVIDRICEAGRFGLKTGAGIYRYPDGRTAQRDSDIETLIVAHSEATGVTRRSFDNGEIVERCLLALINEGARVVGEGIAYRPVDVDMTFLHGYGFSRELGGPMFQADRIGLPAVLERIATYASGRHGWAWSPAPLIGQLVAEGRNFQTLNT